jgi:hypothetical protein
VQKEQALVQMQLTARKKTEHIRTQQPPPPTALYPAPTTADHRRRTFSNAICLMIVARVTMMEILQKGRGGRGGGEGLQNGNRATAVGVLAAGICWVVAPLLRVQLLRLEKRNHQRKREVCNDRNLLVEVFDARIQLPLPDFVAVLQYEEYGRKTGRHHQKHIHLLVVERNYVVQKSHAQLQKKSDWAPIFKQDAHAGNTQPP